MLKIRLIKKDVSGLNLVIGDVIKFNGTPDCAIEFLKNIVYTDIHRAELRDSSGYELFVIRNDEGKLFCKDYESTEYYYYGSCG